MKLHEIDFKSGRKFKRPYYRDFKIVNGCLMIEGHKKGTWEAPHLLSKDILADDWEYCEEEKKEVWYKHIVIFKRYAIKDNYFYEETPIYSCRGFEDLCLGDATIHLSTSKIEKPEWVE